MARFVWSLPMLVHVRSFWGMRHGCLNVTEKYIVAKMHIIWNCLERKLYSCPYQSQASSTVVFYLIDIITLKVLEVLSKQCCAMDWNFVIDCGKLRYPEVMSRKAKGCERV